MYFVIIFDLTKQNKKIMATETATKWVIDPMHSEVQFKVKHLVISTVSGFFKSFGGEVITEGDDFDNAEVDFTLDIANIT